MQRTMNEYCTKINIPQWDILVKVCDELGIKIQKLPTINPYTHYTYVKYDDGVGITTWTTMEDKYDGEVSFPYFLTELRKTQQWTPKAGEKVEVRNGLKSPWFTVTFIGRLDGVNVCRTDDNDYDGWSDDHIRQATPTITSAEAEVKLKTLGVNVKISN